MKEILVYFHQATSSHKIKLINVGNKIKAQFEL